MSIIILNYLKGVFAKNERGYRLSAIKKRFWSLLILLLSVASIRRKLLKTSHTEQLSGHTNGEKCNIQLRPSKINLIQKNHSDITTYSHRLSFATFVYSLYFIMFCTLFVYFSCRLRNYLRMPHTTHNFRNPLKTFSKKIEHYKI